MDAIGSWTGSGGELDSSIPRSEDCYREYYGSDSFKTHKASKEIKDNIKKGLVNHPCNPAKLLFCGPEEPDGDKFVEMFQATVDFVKGTGLDGIYLIYTRSGEEIDMLKTPGLVNATMVEEWVEDMTSNGVLEGKTKHSVCKLDVLNLSLSADALLVSSTAGLKRQLHNSIPADKRNGVRILFELVNICYNPSLAQVEDYIDQLKALSLSKYPGENVTLYVVDAIYLVEKIQLTFIRTNQCPDLLMHALKGLTNATDPIIQDKARRLRLDANTGTYGTASQSSALITN